MYVPSIRLFFLSRCNAVLLSLSLCDHTTKKIARLFLISVLPHWLSVSFTRPRSFQISSPAEKLPPSSSSSSCSLPYTINPRGGRTAKKRSATVAAAAALDKHYTAALLAEKDSHFLLFFVPSLLERKSA